MRFKEFKLTENIESVRTFFSNPSGKPLTSTSFVQAPQVGGLKKYYIDPDIMDLQKALKALGIDPGPIDGKYGPALSNAVTQFQKAHGKIKVDGNAGVETVPAINAALDALVPNAKLVRSTEEEVAKIHGGKLPGRIKTAGQAGDALKEPDFNKRLMQVSTNLGVSAKNLLAIMKHESNLNPKAVNPSSRATGLIQFMPKTAESLGTNIAELYNMSATEQLEYVEKYFKRQGVKSGATLADLYMLTFMPAAVNKPDNFVLGSNQGGEVFGIPARAVYNQNKVFDQDRKGYFTVADVKNRINQFA